MNSIYRTIILVLFLFSLHSSAQTVAKKYSLPGFVQMNDSLFISMIEIDIREYGRFLLIWKDKSGDSQLVQKALPNPNSLDWTLWDNFSSVLIRHTHLYEFIDKDHLTFPPIDTMLSWTAWLGNRPVANITKKQANLYCEFRTKDYEVFYNSQKKKKKERFPEQLFFRLPTASEWIAAASSGLDTIKFRYGVDDVSQKKSLPVSLNTFENDTTGQLHPFPVYYGHLNKSRIFNMCGNISELVSDENFVYGGSFTEPVTECTITSKKEFIQPKSNIGFRVVAVIRNK